ncbi:abortive infection family protein [Pseudomonas simiae]|jgi:hypothetical protein|uniref:abortive infection family protein n=1 Tax=Pseudomonas simiae TaxID=321846 RepID=UPI001654C085|nr:abortive infection family protein [Pseudomonas simiae]MBC3965347.1 abortive infection family protein [Pseudomonas simiae]UNK68474.1 abortive infection family protein [Pseudomonas simiae]WLG36107.1 abortive infection family protein [Pseudomonas simiae]
MEIMTNSDGLAGLAAKAAKVKGERLRLRERLKAFESKLLESSDGTGCSGASKSVTLSSWEHEESGMSGGVYGWLVFTGTKLIVRTEQHADGWSAPDWKDYEIEEALPDWLSLLSVQPVMESLVANISKSLEEEHIAIAATNEWLTEYVAAEKVAIDADLDENLKEHPTLLESWQKARKAVEVDPEDSIARSCSHAETVMKACLKELGDSDHEASPVQALTSQLVKKLREAGTLDEGALKALNGIGPIFHGIGTLRNSSSTAHGKNDGYIAPGPDVAQLINHLAGAGSAFVLKQTEKIVKTRK